MDLSFRLWTLVGRRKEAQVRSYSPGGANVLTWEGTLVQPGEYDWTVCLQQRCSLMSYYFDHLLTSCQSKSASLLDTNGSVVFTRFHECAPYIAHPNWHPQRTGSYPCWVAFGLSTAEPSPFCLENSRFTHWELDPRLIRGSLAHLRSCPKWHLVWFSHFCRARDCNTLLSYSVCSNRPCLRYSAMRPKKTVSLLNLLILFVVLLSSWWRQWFASQLQVCWSYTASYVARRCGI